MSLQQALFDADLALMDTSAAPTVDFTPPPGVMTLEFEHTTPKGASLFFFMTQPTTTRRRMRVVQSMRLAELIPLAASLIPSAKGLTARELALVDPQGHLLSADSLVSDCSLHDGDLLKLERAHEPGFWRPRAERVIVRARHHGASAFDKARQEAERELEEATGRILSQMVPPVELPTLEVSEDRRSTAQADQGLLLHSLRAMFETGGRECLFFDSREGDTPFATCNDAASLSALSTSAADNVTLVFDSVKGCGTRIEEASNKLSLAEVIASDQLRAELESALREHCATAFGMAASAFSSLAVTHGSVRCQFSAHGWTKEQRATLDEAAAYFFTKFPGYRHMEIHPLFKKCVLDVASFDPRGDCTDFLGAQYAMGSGTSVATYYQPLQEQHWYRFGLRVRGKYDDGDDSWLHPFGNPKNWWRVYHGTDVKGLKGIASAAAVDSQFADGHQGAVWASTGGKLGKGVYVTPHLEYCMAGYCGIAELGTGDHARRVAIIFQCAVRPGKRLRSGYPGVNKDYKKLAGSESKPDQLRANFRERYGEAHSEWTFDEADVRPYGILLCNADYLEERYGVRIGGGWLSDAKLGEWESREEARERQAAEALLTQLTAAAPLQVDHSALRQGIERARKAGADAEAIRAAEAKLQEAEAAAESEKAAAEAARAATAELARIRAQEEEATRRAKVERAARQSAALRERAERQAQLEAEYASEADETKRRLLIAQGKLKAATGAKEQAAAELAILAAHKDVLTALRQERETSLEGVRGDLEAKQAALEADRARGQAEVLVTLQRMAASQSAVVQSQADPRRKLLAQATTSAIDEAMAALSETLTVRTHASIQRMQTAQEHESERAFEVRVAASRALAQRALAAARDLGSNADAVDLDSLAACAKLRAGKVGQARAHWRALRRHVRFLAANRASEASLVDALRIAGGQSDAVTAASERLAGELEAAGERLRALDAQIASIEVEVAEAARAMKAAQEELVATLEAELPKGLLPTLSNAISELARALAQRETSQAGLAMGEAEVERLDALQTRLAKDSDVAAMRFQDKLVAELSKDSAAILYEEAKGATQEVGAAHAAHLVATELLATAGEAESDLERDVVEMEALATETAGIAASTRTIEDSEVQVKAKLLQAQEDMSGAQAEELRVVHKAKEGELTITLVWAVDYDLDLHCFTPAGEHIYFSAQKAKCGGELDVDKTGLDGADRAIENIFWKQAVPPGAYKVYVVNYSGTNRVGFTLTISGGGETSFGGESIQQEVRVFSNHLVAPEDTLPQDDPARKSISEPALKMCEFEFESPAKPIRWVYVRSPEDAERQEEAARQLQT